MDDFEYYYLKQITVPLVNYLEEYLFSRAPFKVQRITQHLAKSRALPGKYGSCNMLMHSSCSECQWACFQSKERAYDAEM